MVRNPAVFLLDEPLSNLDAKLRTAMRTEIIKLHQKLGTTFIYVTHDQTEAMTMGDRIVVMKDGFIQQVDTPQNLYDYPCNMFVAGFIGSPQMNFLDATLFKEGDKDVYKRQDQMCALVAYLYACAGSSGTALAYEVRGIWATDSGEDFLLDSALLNGSPYILWFISDDILAVYLDGTTDRCV